MKVSKNSKYQTHKKSIKLTRNPTDGTGAHFLTSIVAKHQKIEGGPLVKKNPKSLTMPKKTERETQNPLGFFNIHSVAKYQKIEVGPFGEKIFVKSLNAEKTEMGTL